MKRAKKGKPENNPKREESGQKKSFM